MQSLIDSYKNSKNLHHAYFLVGEKENTFNEVKDFLEKSLGINTSSNPDFWVGDFENLSIDEARMISEGSERKDFSGNKKIFIIKTDFIGEEAQNSLLKVFEEPTEGTHFFIISPQDILLPTLRSRMQVLFLNTEEGKSLGILKKTYKERLEMVKDITSAISDEEGTKQDAIEFLNRVESELYQKGVEKHSSELLLCNFTRQCLYDRGAPVKMILENLVLSI